METTSRNVFKYLICESLLELGDKASTGEVITQIRAKLAGRLTEADRDSVPSGGDIRWENWTKWERKELVQEGVLYASSRRGTWELTKKGQGIIRFVAGKFAEKSLAERVSLFLQCIKVYESFKDTLFCSATPFAVPRPSERAYPVANADLRTRLGKTSVPVSP